MSGLMDEHAQPVGRRRPPFTSRLDERSHGRVVHEVDNQLAGTEGGGRNGKRLIPRHALGGGVHDQVDAVGLLGGAGAGNPRRQGCDLVGTARGAVGDDLNVSSCWRRIWS